MTQRIEDSNQDDCANVEAKRDWVRNHYEPAAREKYASVEGKLALINTIISNGWIEPNETLKLQCLGIAFGDALAQQMSLDWVAVEDEYGRDPALKLKGSPVLIFPMTSISKRIERGEKVDVYDLFESALSTIRNAGIEGVDID